MYGKAQDKESVFCTEFLKLLTQKKNRTELTQSATDTVASFYVFPFKSIEQHFNPKLISQ